MYWIGSQGFVRSAVFVRREGRQAVLFGSLWGEMAYPVEFAITRSELFANRDDAENFARVVRGWIANGEVY